MFSWARSPTAAHGSSAAPAPAPRLSMNGWPAASSVRVGAHSPLHMLVSRLPGRLFSVPRSVWKICPPTLSATISSGRDMVAGVRKRETLRGSDNWRMPTAAAAAASRASHARPAAASPLFPAAVPVRVHAHREDGLDAAGCAWDGCARRLAGCCCTGNTRGAATARAHGPPPRGPPPAASPAQGWSPRGARCRCPLWWWSSSRARRCAACAGSTASKERPPPGRRTPPARAAAPHASQ